MKKVIALVMVLGLVAPLMAQTNVTISDEGVISVDAAGVRGIAIEVAIPAGMDLTGVELLNPQFNTPIDYYYTNPTLIGDDPCALGGNPIAMVDGPGEQPLPVSGETTVVVCLGVLDELANQAAADAGDIIKLNFDGSGEVCIAANDLRGGVVGDDLGEVTVDDCATISDEPECWGYPCFGKGDANGDGLVSPADVQVLSAAWTGEYDPCADFNKDGLLSPADVQLILDGWNNGCP